MHAMQRGPWPQVAWSLWIAALVCVPITSSPLLSPSSGGENPVTPLSLIPVGGLFLVWLAPYAVRGGRLPAWVKPLVAFLGISLVSAAAAYFLPILPYKGQILLSREVRALSSFVVGIGFYLCASVLPDTEDRLRRSLMAIYAGGVLMLLWSSVQAAVVLSQAEHVPLIVTRIHHLFSVRDPLVDRVTGMAYEPSWLGNQLMVLYVPLFLASVMERKSALPWRRGWLSIEAGMLVWSVLILALTKSRISQLSFLALLVVIVVVLGWRVLQGAVRRLEARLPRMTGAGPMLLRLASGLALLAVVVGLVAGAAQAAFRVDPRLWALPSLRKYMSEARFLYPNDVAFAVADRLAFAERIQYWSAGFRTFSLYPILGVGPGNAGFFFEQTVPEYGLRLTEIQDVLREPSFGFPNPKNLWVRVLAETGIVGGALFGIWFVAVGAGMILLWTRGAGYARVVGLAGSMVFLTQVIEGFSLDTFALPQMWLVFGLGSAALWRSGLVSPDASPPHRGPLAAR
jgi:O-antigen ligase